MKLKSLEATGFKSLVDRLRLTFPDGITTISVIESAGHGVIKLHWRSISEDQQISRKFTPLETDTYSPLIKKLIFLNPPPT